MRGSVYVLGLGGPRPEGPLRDQSAENGAPMTFKVWLEICVNNQQYICHTPRLATRKHPINATQGTCESIFLVKNLFSPFNLCPETK